MPNETVFKDYPYAGALSKLCAGFIAEKRALGYRYNTEAQRMWEFSRFTERFDFPQNTLTQELVDKWLQKRPNESDRTRYSRFVFVKSFAEYMCRMEFEAYVPSRDEAGKIHKSFVPYIFSHDEIKRFFAAVDGMTKPKCTCSPRKHLVMPVLFRVLYCCGLRVSEATGLLGGDVDFNNAILFIRNSKFSKSRYVPMSDELLKVCAEYSKTRYRANDGDDLFFAGPRGTRYGKQGVYRIFRQLLHEAGISHAGKGKGPRLHDLRHTFAVHSLQKLVSEGKDLTSVLPKLSSFLGHVGIESSESYLRMTAEVYPQISELLNEKLGYIVPMEGFYHENN